MEDDVEINRRRHYRTGRTTRSTKNRRRYPLVSPITKRPPNGGTKNARRQRFVVSPNHQETTKRRNKLMISMHPTNLASQRDRRLFHWRSKCYWRKKAPPPEFPG